MDRWSRRGVLAGAAATGAGLVLAGGASAHTRTAGRGVLDIVTGEDGFTAPERTPAGRVSFRLRTTSALTGAAGVVRLRRGVEESDFRTRLRRIFSTEGAENIAAAKELMASAELYGGGFTHVGTATRFTLDLTPGRYLVLEFLDFEQGRGREPAPGDEYVTPLRVMPAPRGAAPGTPTAPPAATLTACEVPGAGPRFTLRGQVRAGRPVRYVNAMRGQVNEAVLYPVPDDAVTERDIQAFFDGTGPVPFDLSRWLGTPPLTSGRDLVLDMPLTPGRYAAVTWVTSIHDAVPLAVHGQHRLLTVV